MVNATPQAVIKIIRNGGTRSPAQIRNQWRYISKDDTVELELPDDAQGALLQPEDWTQASKDWAVSTGRYALGQATPAGKDMTTHIVVSFPPGTDPEKARNASRAWAEAMFRQAQQEADDWDDDDNMSTDRPAAAPPHDLPQNYNYVAAFHTDRDHPHMHIVVNRRGDEGGWLKISKRHPLMNYDTMREKLVEAAAGEGIELESTSRAERGIEGRPMNDAQYRRLERERLIEINPANNTNRPLNSDSESEDGFDYDDDSEVQYRIAPDAVAGRAGAGDRMDIPGEIHVDGGARPGGNEARMPSPRHDGYDADSEDGDGSGRKRGRDAQRDSSSDEDSSDDGGGKPAALTGEALEALLASRRQAAAAAGSGSATAGPDQTDIAASTRMRPAADLAQQTTGLDSDVAMQEPDRPADSDLDSIDFDNLSDAERSSAAEEASDSDTGSVDLDDQAEPARRRRTDVPERTMVLRSDTERQRRADEEAGLHLRSGRIILKREREEDRAEERNTRPRQR